MMTAELDTTLAEIVEHAESIRNDEHQFAGEMSTGDAWAQGDIAIVCLDKLPKGIEKIPTQSQLAPGNTQGSRHCLDSVDGITMYQFNDASVLDGPIIYAPSGFRVNHPEHGDVTFRPGVYAIVYQRAYAEELRRVQD